MISSHIIITEVGEDYKAQASLDVKWCNFASHVLWILVKANLLDNPEQDGPTTLSVLHGTSRDFT